MRVRKPKCLWHVEQFRRGVERVGPNAMAGQPVAASLARLFIALSAAEEEGGKGSGEGGGEVVDPNELREALDALPNHDFRMGTMNDPSEVLTAIYECLAKVPQLKQGTSPNPLVNDVFGLLLKQQLDCRAKDCEKTSHPIAAHTEYYHIVQATALRMMGSGSMASILVELAGQDQKKCDKDIGGCDMPGTPTRELLNDPHVFTLLMAWEEQVSGEEVKATLDLVDTELTLSEMYDNHPAGSYRLHAMFCYYGQHYHAFIHKGPVRQWVMFDDAHVAAVGSWQEVIRKCTKGRIQPLVLFYMRV